MSETPTDEISDDEMEDLSLVRPDPEAIKEFLSEMERRGHDVELAVFEPPAADERGSSTLSVELRWDGEEDRSEIDETAR